MFSLDDLLIEPARACEQIQRAVSEQVLGVLRRRGVVVGLSGGVDSSVVTALCVRALGPQRVLALLMPEGGSGPESLKLGHEWAERLGVATEVEDIAPALEGLGCYRRQAEAIRQVFPDFKSGGRFKLSLLPLLGDARFNVFRLTIETDSGELRTARMPVGGYLQLVAATSFKQRLRKSLEYYHADRLGYAVAGTPNLLEYDQGFFVKQGDGAADIKPIAHLLKTQVYQLAQYLEVPEAVRSRPPTTETYPLPQTQEEFFFAVPHAVADACLHGLVHGIPAGQVASALALNPEQVEVVYRDLAAKRRATYYLRAPPLLVEEST